MRKQGLLAALLLFTPALAEAKTLDELLVEKGVITRDEAMKSKETSPAKVYWNDGTRLEFPDTGFTTKISTLLISRYEFIDPEKGGSVSTFDVKLARLYVSGTALDKEFSYMISGDFVGDKDASGKKTAALKDAYIAWQPCDWGWLKMGQYKTAVSRQFNTGDEKLQFPDNTRATSLFKLDRQGGISGQWMSEDEALKFGAGMFNGESDGEGINRSGVDTREMGQVNARWDAMGKMNAFEEGDLGHTEDAALNLGAAYAYTRSRNEYAVFGELSNGLSSVSADVNFKYVGFSTHGEFYYSRFNVEEGDGDATAVGGYVQVGYFVMPKKVELAARYAYVDCDEGKVSSVTGGNDTVCDGNDSVNQATAGVNYHFWKNNLKAQFAYDYLSQEKVTGTGDDETTSRWIFQLVSAM